MLWIVDNTGDELWRLDDLTDPSMAVLVGTFPSGITIPAGITALNGSLWIINNTGDELWRLDDVTAPSTAVLVGAFPGGLQSPLGITALNGSLWIADFTGDELWRLDDLTDPSMAVLVGTFPSGITVPAGITALNGSLWIADDSGDELWRLDDLTAPSTAVLVGSSFSSNLSSLSAITALNGSLWIANDSGDELWRLDDVTAPSTAVLVGAFPGGLQSPLGITGLSLLSNATAPTVSIDAVADFDEGGTVTLSAVLAGGTYDEADHAWAIDSGGGSLDDAAAVTPVYTPADVSSDTLVTISLEITARGTGTDAADSTSDTSNDTESFTVLVVLGLSNYTVPSGYETRVLALIETGLVSRYIYNSGDSTGSLLEGELVVDNADITVSGIRGNASGTSFLLYRSGTGSWVTSFDTGGTYDDAVVDIQTLNDGTITVEHGDTDRIRNDNIRYAMDAAQQATWGAITSGDRIILAIRVPEALLPNASAPTVAIDAIADGDEGTDVELSATITGGTYDALDYVWTVPAGTLANGTTATPIWTRPLVTADTDYQPTLALTARGTGTNAEDGTDDTTNATADATTVSNVPDTPGTQTITLPGRASADADWDIAIAIDSSLIEGGGPAFLRFIGLSGNSVRVQLSVTADGNPAGAGPDFNSDFIVYEAAFTFSLLDGSDPIVLKGPNHTDNTFAEGTEPYFWTPDNGAAFVAWVAALDTSPARLFLDDGTGGSVLPDAAALAADIATGIPSLTGDLTATAPVDSPLAGSIEAGVPGLAADLTVTAAVATPLAGSIAVGVPTLSASLTVTAPGGVELAADIATGSPALSAQLTVSAPAASPLAADIQTGAPSLSADLTVQAPIQLLVLSDYTVPSGYETRVLALIETGLVSRYIYNANDSTGSLVEGELVVDNADITVSGIRGNIAGTSFLLYRSGTGSWITSFDTGGTYDDAVVDLQTLNDGTITVDHGNADRIRAADIRYAMDAAQQATWAAIDSGERAILAIRVPLTAPLAADIATGVPSLTADLTVTAPGGVALAGSIGTGVPRLTADLAVTAAVATPLAGSIVVGVPTLSASLTVTAPSGVALAGSIEAGVPELAADLTVTVTAATPLAGSISTGIPSLVGRLTVVEQGSSRWSIPAIFARAGISGPEGEDGLGVEFVYAVTGSGTITASQYPSNAWGYDQPGTRGGLVWNDGAPSLTIDTPILWQSARAVPGVPEIGDDIDANWGVPTIIGRYGDDGQGVENIFAITNSDTLPTSQNPSNTWGYDEPATVDGLQWHDDIQSVSPTIKFLWQATRKIVGQPVVGVDVTDDWSTPQRVASYGDDGAGFEYIFAVTDVDALTSSQYPSNTWTYDNPGTSGGLIWEDDVQPVTADNKYLFEARRPVLGAPVQGDDVTADWGVPALISTYGDKGDPAVSHILTRTYRTSVTTDPEAGEFNINNPNANNIVRMELGLGVGILTNRQDDPYIQNIPADTILSFIDGEVVRQYRVIQVFSIVAGTDYRPINLELLNGEAGLADEAEVKLRFSYGTGDPGQDAWGVGFTRSYAGVGIAPPGGEGEFGLRPGEVDQIGIDEGDSEEYFESVASGSGVWIQGNNYRWRAEITSSGERFLLGGGIYHWRFSTRQIGINPDLTLDEDYSIVFTQSGGGAAIGDTAPGPPRNLGVDADGQNALDVSWSAPLNNGGQPVTGYNVQESTNGTTFNEVAASQTALTFRRTGLSAGTRRYYRVAAINSVGTGNPASANGITDTASLPNASAPSITIDSVSSVDEDDTLSLSVSATGGTYDTRSFAWTVVSGGGSISGSGLSVTYNPPSVSSDTSVRVRCTVTVTGTGTDAASGTSDTDSDDELFTVNDVSTPVLPDADAPALTISAASSVDENDTLTMSVTTSGGVYDTISYAWEVVSGGGSIDPSGSSVTYNPPNVSSDTSVDVRCTATATGTGTVARSGTSDTSSDTDSFTVNVVIGLPNASAPSVNIINIDSVAEGGTQSLSVVTSGGIYDTISRVWEVVSGGGSINQGVYTPPDVTADTDVRIRYTVTVTGTGTNAIDGTSDTDFDTEDFIVTPDTPDAVAPSLAISAASSVDEDDTLSLSVVPSGGVYDSVSYAWEVVSGGGSIDSSGLSVTYSPIDVDSDTTVQVRCTATAIGSGVNAASGTSDTSTRTVDFIVNDVPLPNASAPITINIFGIDSLDEDDTHSFVASRFGGVFDVITSAWSVDLGGGSFNGSTYTPPNVSINTNVRVRWTLMVSGTGTNAADGTTDSGFDTEDFVVNVVNSRSSRRSVLPLRFGPTLVFGDVSDPFDIEWTITDTAGSGSALSASGNIVSFATTEPPPNGATGLWVRTMRDDGTDTLQETGRAFVPWCAEGTSLAGGGIRIKYGHGGGGFGIRFRASNLVTADQIEVSWAT